MGAWGEEPFESDAALDAIDPLFDTIVEGAEQIILDSDHPHEILGAAEILIRLERLYQASDEAVTSIFETANEEMAVVGQWRDPRAREKVLIRVANAADRELGKRKLR